MRPLQERVHADAFLDVIHAYVSANSRAHRITGSVEFYTLGNVKLETDRADENYGRRISWVDISINPRPTFQGQGAKLHPDSTMNCENRRFKIFAFHFSKSASFVLHLHFVCHRCAALYFVFTCDFKLQAKRDLLSSLHSQI